MSSVIQSLRFPSALLLPQPADNPPNTHTETHTRPAALHPPFQASANLLARRPVM